MLCSHQEEIGGSKIEILARIVSKFDLGLEQRALPALDLLVEALVRAWDLPEEHAPDSNRVDLGGPVRRRALEVGEDDGGGLLRLVAVGAEGEGEAFRKGLFSVDALRPN